MLIIRQLAQRLGEVLGEPERAARLRGEEFGVLLPGADVALARQIGDKILDLFERPFMVQGLPIEVAASVGIAAAPEHGQETELLLRRADLAVQAAKRLASGCVVYSSECDPYDPRRLALLGELRPAIEADQLFLYYQPKVDLSTSAVVGAEALLRWRRPRRGLVPPGDFIPLAEQAGVIKPLTWWVLGEAVRQCGAWEKGSLGLEVAVNLSARSLHDPQLMERITGLLDAHEVPPRRLQLEVPDGQVLSDLPRSLDALHRLKDLGVTLVLDRVAVRYSSLGRLAELPQAHQPIVGFDLDEERRLRRHDVVRIEDRLGQAAFQRNGADVTNAHREPPVILQAMSTAMPRAPSNSPTPPARRKTCEGIAAFRTASSDPRGLLSMWPGGCQIVSGRVLLPSFPDWGGTPPPVVPGDQRRGRPV